jgi:hypothetical protein
MIKDMEMAGILRNTGIMQRLSNKRVREKQQVWLAAQP